MHFAFYRDNRGWLATGLILALGSSFGQTYFISLFAGEIRGTFGLTNGDWGQLYTIATLTSAMCLVQAGRLADTVPLRRLAALVICLFAAATLTMAYAPSVWALGVAVFLLRFCGQGMMSHISLTAMGRWFRANRGRALAVAVMGYPIGEALLPPLAVPLIDAIGWRQVWVVAAGVLIAGLLPLMMWLMAEERAPQGEGPSETATGRLGARHWNRGEVVRNWSFWALLPGILAPSFIGTAIFFHQVHIADSAGWDLGTMALGYSIYAGLSVAGSMLSGGWIDRFGPERFLPFFLIPLGLCCLVLGQGQSEIAWFAGLALMGISTGLYVTVNGAIWPSLYGTRHLGAIKALATAAMVLSTAIGPGITGTLIDLGIPFLEQMPALAIWCFATSAGFVLVRRRLLQT